jgi:hypothetical protein
MCPISGVRDQNPGIRGALSRGIPTKSLLFKHFSGCPLSNRPAIVQWTFSLGHPVVYSLSLGSCFSSAGHH